MVDIKIPRLPTEKYKDGHIHSSSILHPYTGVNKKLQSFLERLLPPYISSGQDFSLVVEQDGKACQCKFSDIVEAFKLVSDSDNSDKYVKTEEKLVDRSYVVEYHGYSAEDVKLLINQEG